MIIPSTSSSGESQVFYVYFFPAETPDVPVLFPDQPPAAPLAKWISDALESAEGAFEGRPRASLQLTGFYFGGTLKAPASRGLSITS